MTTRPSLFAVKTVFDNAIRGTSHNFPRISNKGDVGQRLETLLGIPNSSACLDCSDGELKLFPVKKLANGVFSPKETIAITTRGLKHDKQRPFSRLKSVDTWENSALKKKTDNLLFISYFRDGDNITFLHSYLFNSECPEYAQFKVDYNTIMNHYNTNGICQLAKGEPTYISNTVNGKYIQGRTKGAGGPNKTVAFYFRSKEFVKNVILSAP